MKPKQLHPAVSPACHGGYWACNSGCRDGVEFAGEEDKELFRLCVECSPNKPCKPYYHLLAQGAASEKPARYPVAIAFDSCDNLAAVANDGTMWIHACQMWHEIIDLPQPDQDNE